MSDPVEHAHRQLMDQGRVGVPWHRLDPKAYDPELIDQARRLWSARHDNEYQSVVVFSQLALWAAEAGVELDLIGSTTRLVADEVRHAELCARLADLLGGCDRSRLTPEAYRLRRGPRSILEEVERLVLAVFCIGETVSVELIRASLDATTEEVPRAVLTELLRDEAFHRQFGWAYAERHVDRRDPSQRARIEAILPAAFAHYERVCVTPAARDLGPVPPRRPRPPPDLTQPNFGYASDEANAAAFYRAMADDVIARFAALGIDAHRAWRERPASREE